MQNVKTSVVEFDLMTNQSKKQSIEEFNLDPHNNHKLYWIHCNLNETENFKKISDKIHLPSEVIKVCRETDAMPKLIDRDESVTIKIQCLLNTNLPENNEVIFENLVIHLTDKFCFTASFETFTSLHEFIHTYQKSVRYAQTPCFILFLLFDNIINDYAKLLFNFEILLEKLDFASRSENTSSYKKIMNIKRESTKLKRYIIASREILMRISGRNIAVISKQCKTSLYNLSNHSHMLTHQSDSIRDMLNSLLDGMDNLLMQRMNRTMQVLTAFAAIFLPLTLITGIYGMNFIWMPELNWKYGYFAVLIFLFICAVILLGVFKKMKWF